MIEVYHSEGATVLTKKALRMFYERFNRRIVNPLCSFKYDLFEGQGIDVMAEDWDNLIILDACRYDFFKQESDLSGRLESRISRGAMSWEFMKGNFVGRKLHDTVYITANPFVYRLEDEIFHTIIDEPLTKEWDTMRGTVLPNSVTEAALNAFDQYPNKRLIIHYMQPHLPPIGDIADDINERIELSGFDKYHSHSNKVKQKEGTSLWAAYRKGLIDRSTVIAAYRESLSIVLNSVNELLDGLNGKSVITADHGELLGEKPCFLLPKSFGHDNLPRTEKLCKIPWFVVDGGESRRITKEPPIKSDSMDQDIAERRLEQLGYKM